MTQPQKPQHDLKWETEMRKLHTELMNSYKKGYVSPAEKKIRQDERAKTLKEVFDAFTYKAGQYIGYRLAEGIEWLKAELKSLEDKK